MRGLVLVATQYLCFAQAEDIVRNVYNLVSDPYETSSLIDDASISSTLDLLEARFDLWRNISVVEYDVEDTMDFSIFNQAGGYVPWLDYDFPPSKPTRPTSSARTGAPNLVFMLLDDGMRKIGLALLPSSFCSLRLTLMPVHFAVGWNDVGYHGSTWIDFATPNIDLLASEGIKLMNHYSG